MSGSGSLTVVGTGIQLLRQTTLEALQHIRDAEKLLYLVADDVTAAWLAAENPTAESLGSSLRDGEPRLAAYQEMVGRMLAPVRDGARVCAVFYGHPGVFVFASHEAVRQAREAGLEARMLPGVSAEDCLFADLGIDPASHGCQSFEATDFLLCKRIHDPRSVLVLWQVGLVGYVTTQASYDDAALTLLQRVLSAAYPPDHELILYRASTHPEAAFEASRFPLDRLGAIEAGKSTTLVVPPLAPAEADPERVAELNALLL